MMQKVFSLMIRFVARMRINAICLRVSVIRMLCAILICFSNCPLLAQKVALIIGNNDYQHSSVLKSPIRDARDMTTVLSSHGFSTATLINATRQDMVRSIRSLQAIGTQADVCLFYFSGHGSEVNGINYLSPVDGILRDRDDLDNKLFSLANLLKALQETNAQRKIVVLDCCRNDPFNLNSGGLAAVAPGLLPRGTLVVYAGSPGNTVPDGIPGTNSPYTAELLRQLSPGRDVLSIFTSVSAMRFHSIDPWVSFDGGVDSLRSLSRYDLLGEEATRAAPKWPQDLVRANPAPVQPVVSDPNPLKIASYWDHNGSTMGLLVLGERRIMVYIKVRAGMQGLVEPGMVLFDGASTKGIYKGQARRFSKGLKPLAYDVSGPILDNGSRVVLSGKAAVRNPDGSTLRVIDDRLEFKFLHLARE